jgi:prevent-host-death family protein
LREAEEGEEIIITRNNQPVARLSPINSKRDEKRRATAVRRMQKLMEKGLDLGGRSYSRDEMHED